MQTDQKASPRNGAGVVTIEVDILQLRFGPSEAGFCIMLGRTVEDGKPIMLAGAGGLARIQVKDRASVVGRFETHAKYGRQFRVEGASVAVKPTPDGVQRYIERCDLPGVGKARAKALVEAFGVDALARLEQRDLSARTIIGPRAEEAFDRYTLLAQRAGFNAVLAAAGLNQGQCTAVWERYGDATPTIVAGDPYRLPAEVAGVGFRLADKLAQAIGYDNDLLSRARAGVVEVARIAAEKMGFTGVPRHVLARESAEMLEISRDDAGKAIDLMIGSGALVVGHWQGKEIIQPRYLADAEEAIASAILAKLKEPTLSHEVTTALAAAEEECDVKLDEQQREAAILALTVPICVIDGPPGSGKTSVVRVVLAAQRRLNPHFRTELAAPIGKAAGRLSEVTGQPARTIHRLLDYANGNFRRNAKNPLTCDLLVIDEMSLTDTPLAAKVAEAWGTSRVVIQGDANQLPSVGPGRVLADLIASGAVPHVRLATVHRQKGEAADIPLACLEILEGRAPPEYKAGQSPFVSRFQQTSEEAAQAVVDMAVNGIPRFLGLDEPALIVAPARTGPAGVIALNAAVQAKRHGRTPTGAAAVAYGQVAARGDRVIVLDNDYDREVFNGDTGVVLSSSDEKSGRLKLRLDDGREVEYVGRETTGVALAYALTAHRVQGSEYSATVTVLTTGHSLMLTRELLNTALSRGKQLSVLAGQRRARDIALRNSELGRRITGLVSKLKTDRGHPSKGEDPAPIALASCTTSRMKTSATPVPTVPVGAMRGIDQLRMGLPV